MSCCTSYLELGCISACGTAELPFQATQTGQHTLVVEFAGVEFQQTFNATVGDNFTIPLADLNESGCIKFRIIQPNGERYTTTVDSVDYMCFKFNTTIAMVAQASIEECTMVYVDCNYWDDDYSE